MENVFQVQPNGEIDKNEVHEHDCNSSRRVDLGVERKVVSDCLLFAKSV